MNKKYLFILLFAITFASTAMQRINPLAQSIPEETKLHSGVGLTGVGLVAFCSGIYANLNPWDSNSLSANGLLMILYGLRLLVEYRHDRKIRAQLH